MRKEIARSLMESAQRVAEIFSDKERKFNTAQESFFVGDIKELSEYTAAVIYNKTSGKQALVFFYYIEANGGEWRYFFPKESHIYGMQKLRDIHYEIEQHNFKYNGEIKAAQLADFV